MRLVTIVAVRTYPIPEIRETTVPEGESARYVQRLQDSWETVFISRRFAVEEYRS